MQACGLCRKILGWNGSVKLTRGALGDERHFISECPELQRSEGIKDLTFRETRDNASLYVARRCDWRCQVCQDVVI